jgi:hypothetical protein
MAATEQILYLIGYAALLGKILLQVWQMTKNAGRGWKGVTILTGIVAILGFGVSWSWRGFRLDRWPVYENTEIMWSLGIGILLWAAALRVWKEQDVRLALVEQIFALLLATLVLFLADSPTPPAPAKQSGWFVLYRLASLAAYTGLLVAGLSGCFTLASPWLPETWRVSMKEISWIGLISVQWGFPLMTVTAVVSSVWAFLALGQFWPLLLGPLRAWLVWLIYLWLLQASARWANRPRLNGALRVVGGLLALIALLGAFWAAPSNPGV